MKAPTIWATGSVYDAECCRRPAKLSEEKLLDIFDSILQSPLKSLQKLAQQHDIGLATAQSIDDLIHDLQIY